MIQTTTLFLSSIVTKLPQNSLVWQDNLLFLSILYLVRTQVEVSSAPRGVGRISLWLCSARISARKSKMPSLICLAHLRLWLEQVGAVWVPLSLSTFFSCLAQASLQSSWVPRGEAKVARQLPASAQKSRSTSTAFCYSKQIPRPGQVLQGGE